MLSLKEKSKQLSAPKKNPPTSPRKKPTHSPNQKPTQQLVLLCLNQASIPFAVIGSNQLIEVKGKKIRGRLYPWGVVEVENPEHNDFLKLRTMLVWVMQASLRPLLINAARMTWELHERELFNAVVALMKCSLTFFLPPLLSLSLIYCCDPLVWLQKIFSVF